MSSAGGFTLTYTSARRLDADHAAYLAHGGIVLDLTTADVAEGAPITVELLAPGDRTFRLDGVVDHAVPGRGVSVSFAPAVLADLDAYVLSPDFRALRDADPDPIGPAPDLRPRDAEDLTTDPRMPTPSAAALGDDPAASRTRARPSRARRRPAPAAPPAPAPPAPARTSRRPRPRPVEPEPAPLEVPTTPPPAAPDPSVLSSETLTDPVTEATEPRDPTGEAPAPAARPPRGDPPTASAAAPEAPPTRAAPPGGADRQPVRAPEPGEEYFVFVVKFPTIASFVALGERFERTCVMAAPFEDDGLTPARAIAQLRLTLPGRNVFEMWAVVEAVEPERVLLRVDDNDEAFRKAVLHPTTVAARKRLEREATRPPEEVSVLRIKQEKPKEDLERMPIRRRLARMGMDDKINLALSGGREERMALAQDGNKAVHHYLLKNAKITLDEVAFMARLPSLNPDVLDKIAENPAYTQNPSVTKALVYNPRTPVKTAIRLLDRLPRSEVMNLAKRTTMNQRLVMAAKKKIERRSR